MGFKMWYRWFCQMSVNLPFNALTKAGIEAANYPFCTIEPNTGVVPMPDPRLDALAEIVKPERVFHPPWSLWISQVWLRVQVKGEGLGNKFLANIPVKLMQFGWVMLFVVLKMMTSCTVAGKIDPFGDIETINTELALLPLDGCELSIQRLQNGAKGGPMRRKICCL